MYSIDLKQISLDEFESILVTSTLLPFQKPVLVNLNENIKILKTYGIKDLKELKEQLKNKKKLLLVAQKTGIDEEYIKKLNMMVNSFIVKPIYLNKLDIFSAKELNFLENSGIKNTKQYYETFIEEQQRAKTSSQSSISNKKLEYALSIIDLLRINGVGVQYAKMLNEIGIKCVRDYNNTSSQIILDQINKLNTEKKISKATLGISDIDYCRRFSERLDNNMEF